VGVNFCKKGRETADTGKKRAVKETADWATVQKKIQNKGKNGQKKKRENRTQRPEKQLKMGQVMPR